MPRILKPSDIIFAIQSTNENVLKAQEEKRLRHSYSNMSYDSAIEILHYHYYNGTARDKWSSSAYWNLIGSYKENMK